MLTVDTDGAGLALRPAPPPPPVLAGEGGAGPGAEDQARAERSVRDLPQHSGPVGGVGRGGPDHRGHRALPLVSLRPPERDPAEGGSHQGLPVLGVGVGGRQLGDQGGHRHLPQLLHGQPQLDVAVRTNLKCKYERTGSPDSSHKYFTFLLQK